MSAESRTAVTEEERWHLNDEREFLLRSLDDAEVEHDAGDLGDDDYELLRRRDTARLAEVEAVLATLGPDTGILEAGDGAGAAEVTPLEDPVAQDAVDGVPGEEGSGPVVGRRGRRRRRRWMALVGAAAVVAGVVLLVVDITSPRLPGQDSSGSTELGPTAQLQENLAQAADLVNENTPTSIAEALGLYEAILKKYPKQPQALAETGWLEWQAGAKNDSASLVNAGMTLEEQSLKLQPDDYDAHLFYGTMLFEQNQASSTAAALTEFRAFVAEHPPASALASAAPLLRKAFAQGGQPLPAGVPTS